MELASSLSAAFPADKLAPNSIPSFTTSRHFCERNFSRATQIRIKATAGGFTSRKRNPPRRRLYSLNNQLLIDEQELDEDDGDEEGQEEDEYDTVDDAAILSLSMKPDRTMALLDDYEMEELDYSADPNHRSASILAGFVAVLGKPNVGKSTLSNQMIGQKLCIVTDKPQTTRHRILGICSAPEYQIVLYDTPGVMQKQMHKLDTMMMKNVRRAAVDADCVLVIVDASKTPEKIDEVLEEGGSGLGEDVPVLLVLNKKDLIKPGEIAKKLQVATAARLDIEDFLQKKVYIEMEVKVRENWRQDEALLKNYGYGGQIRAF